MTIWLDTNVLWNREFMGKIPTFSSDVAISAIVYFERVRQLKKHGIEATKFLNFLNENEIEICEFTSEQAEFMPKEIVEDDVLWKSLARDVMIASHVGPTDVLVTSNIFDFLKLGLPESRIEAV